ncbi:CASP8 protein, partial [Centropus bengalensis]|nr:CASP8 protein [Centropus bengalensis]
MSTEFQKLLFDVSEALVTEELEALMFLSLEHISMGKLEAIQRTLDFFKVLQEKGLIEPKNLHYLKELMYCISRIDILEAYLGSRREEMERVLQIPGRAKVSAYRKLLHRIAEDLSPEDVKKVKFLLRKQIPKNKLQDNASMLKVFLEMERNGMIREDNLEELKNIFNRVRPDVKKKIDAYEEKLKGEFLICCLRVELGGFFCDFPGSVFKSYKMQNIPHGYCVILNNHIFKNPCENREGTIEDGEAVKRVFNWLQFQTVEHMNLEAKEIHAKVKEYSKKDHSNMDCFVCFIFSHGEKDKVKGVDDELVNIKDLVTCFSGSNCPSLAGKPKLFFIQACQGSVGHPAVRVEDDSSGRLETDAVPLTSIPDQADILIGMATVEDYESYRDIQTGSIYIQCLCEKMELLCPLQQDLVSILTEVNNQVGRRVLKGRKQMPIIKSTLRKILIFPIP